MSDAPKPDKPAAPEPKEPAADVAPPPDEPEALDEPEPEADDATPDEPDPPEQIAAMARTTALAYAREVTELCKLAGLADRAAEFIKAETAIEQVRTALLEARARIDAETRIDGSHAPGAVKMPVAAEWERVINRKFSK